MKHFVLVPLLTQGHMIPMLDMARLIADRGALVSFITTPLNATRIKPLIDEAKATGVPIRFIELKLTCIGGLPEGHENFDLIPQHLFKSLFDSISLLQAPLYLHLRETEPPVTCMISDYCDHWTMKIALEMNIRRFIFHGPSCFFLLSSLNIRKYKVYENLNDYFEPVIVPELPHRIEITRAQAPGWFSEPGYEEMLERILESEAAADGIVMNTFYELEEEYVDRYRKAMGAKLVLTVGPLSLRNKDVASKATRGNNASIEEHLIIDLLNTKEPRSVLYVSFGSVVRLKPLNLIEIGCGLEATKIPFIWVIKEAENCEVVKEWMVGFKERTKEQGLVIIGWAPQLLILSHVTIGGFMTHCGWNSILESISTGVPMITWPHFVDQFLNERLVVEVLKIGIGVGVKVPFHFVEEDELCVKREEIEKVVKKLMDGGEEGKGRRKRAMEYSEKAHMAMEEGGSSYKNLTRLIEYA